MSISTKSLAKVPLYSTFTVVVTLAFAFVSFNVLPHTAESATNLIAAYNFDETS